MTGISRKTIKSYSPADYIDIEKYYGNKIYYVRNIDPGTLYSYDLSTGKVRKVASNVTGIVEQPSGNLYTTGTRTVRIRRYYLAAGKRATLVSSLRIKKIKKVGASYITYVNSNGKTVKKTF